MNCTTGDSNTTEARSRRFVRTLPEAFCTAVEAVEGLAGFVGVDFIWDEQSRHATILEINPRPTTSVVGLCRLLPRGPSGAGMARGVPPVSRDESCSKALPVWSMLKKPLFSMRLDDFIDEPGANRAHEQSHSLRIQTSCIALDIGGANIKVAHSWRPGLDDPV